jgi:hypothetical protein
MLHGLLKFSARAAYRRGGNDPKVRQTRLSEHSRLSMIARWTMHAFDFILVLLCFVYAAAVTHLRSTAGEIIIASKRIRLSWINAGWMLVALLFACV